MLINLPCTRGVLTRSRAYTAPQQQLQTICVRVNERRRRERRLQRGVGVLNCSAIAVRHIDEARGRYLIASVFASQSWRMNITRTLSISLALGT